MTAPPPVATGPRRWLYLAAGLFCVGMGYVGAIVPGIPTTPWLILASGCFARSSPRLQRWLYASPVFGRLIRDWDTHRGVRRPVKVAAVLTVVVVVTLSITLSTLPAWVKVCIGCLAAVGVGVIVFVLPTIPRESTPAEGGAEGVDLLPK